MAFPIIIFADGASSGNPGPGGWGAVIVTPAGHVVELGGGDPSTTNNKMELMATIRALEHTASQKGEVHLYTDSVYVIRGITQWIWGWRKKGWKTAEGAEVANQELWKRLSAAVASRDKSAPISWKFVKGHSGVPGNERVDEIAVSYSKGRPSSLYQGPLLQYSIAIHDLPPDVEVPAPKEKAGPKPKAYAYLSLIGNTPMRHSDWPSCERRVKGQSGAKFKKVMSAEEEAQVLKSWGFSTGSLRDNS